MAFSWKATIGTVAPVLAGIFGTPAAGVAVAALCKAAGMEATPENAQKIAEQGLSGDQIVMLRKVEADVKIQMAKLGMDFDVQTDELTFKDRDSARNREIQVRDHTPAIGFYLITLGFFGLLAMMLFHVIPDENKTVLTLMTGSLGTAWVSCIGYFYGSSASSKRKDELLFNSTPTEGGN